VEGRRDIYKSEREVKVFVQSNEQPGTYDRFYAESYKGYKSGNKVLNKSIGTKYR
jgi:hypothetical protein